MNRCTGPIPHEVARPDAYTDCKSSYPRILNKIGAGSVLNTLSQVLFLSHDWSDLAELFQYISSRTRDTGSSYVSGCDHGTIRKFIRESVRIKGFESNDKVFSISVAPMSVI